MAANAQNQTSRARRLRRLSLGAQLIERQRTETSGGTTSAEGEKEGGNRWDERARQHTAARACLPQPYVANWGNANESAKKILECR